MSCDATEQVTQHMQRLGKENQFQSEVWQIVVAWLGVLVWPEDIPEVSSKKDGDEWSWEPECNAQSQPAIPAHSSRQ